MKKILAATPLHEVALRAFWCCFDLDSGPWARKIGFGMIAGVFCAHHWFGMSASGETIGYGLCHVVWAHAGLLRFSPRYCSIAGVPLFVLSWRGIPGIYWVIFAAMDLYVLSSIMLSV